ncbi:hypothetical protein SASPL_120205 [Salvia splendens]|uniref:Cyclin-dependent kinase inhibitor n=1 Tax=Salvia splendens TaxID=180675 RepID=A0A8X8ZTR7_SALSN|nr:hypothetical protein SASPL_120205 [Salvia splendens]
METGSSSCWVAEEGCCTPKRGIPARTTPPPPPRKKPVEKKNSPKGGYFEPPDLEQLFVALRRAEACV